MGLPLAVLIDAENIPSRLFAQVQEAVLRHGTPIVWQVHGDFHSAQRPDWVDIARQENLSIQHCFRNGKNAADISMTIAAMDLMQAGKIRGMCLVSSDSDFTALAQRLRAGGMAVHGIGESKTVEAYRKACDNFDEIGMGPATATAKAGTSAQDAARLRRLLHEIIRTYGQDGAIAATQAASYLQQRDAELAKVFVGKGRFIKSIRQHGNVDVAETGKAPVLRLRKTAAIRLVSPS